VTRPSPPPESDVSSSLLRRIRKQDPDAWKQLVEWIGPFVLHWCRRANLQTVHRDEVSRKVFQRIRVYISQFRSAAADESFSAWVYTIILNQCRDLLELRRSDPVTLSDIALPSEIDSAQAPDLQQRATLLVLQEAMATSGEDAGFKAFYRTVVDGLSPAGAAKELGLDAWAVRRHKYRWIKYLRDKLQDDFGELLG
jgi:RNA polymerase sigma-70 factor, ECF subfamily